MDLQTVCLNCGAALVPGQRPKTYCSKRCRASAQGKRNYARHLERKREKNRSYSATHREELRQYAAGYYEENRDAQKARQRRYNAEHREAINAKNLANHHADKNQRNAERLKWYFDHHEYSKKDRQVRAAQSRIDTPWKKLLYIAKLRAVAKGVPFSLTEAWAESRWTGTCELTDIPFKVTRPNGGFYSPSIDRIKAALGYTPENCRFILFAVNTFKGQGTDDDMMAAAIELIGKSYIFQ